MHDHSGDGEDHDHDVGRNLRNLAIALSINTVFFVVELVGALYANSLTLLADAAHMLTDSASLGLALLAAWIAMRPADAKRTYGYQRAEILGALANGVFLLGVVIYILYDSIQRFQDPEPINAPIVIGIGVLGLIANLLAAYVIMGDRENLNVEGAFLHLLADAAGSVAAIVLGIVLLFTDFYLLDPVFAVLVAALVLYSTKDLLLDSVNILLQGTPREIDLQEVRSFLADTDSVEDVHDVHIWALSSNDYAMSAHVVVNEDADRNAILTRYREELGNEFGIDHVTLQLESETEVETADFDCYRPSA